jgi:hypothetical protein
MHWKSYLYIILLNIALAVPGAKAMDNRNQLSIRSPERFSTAIRQAESRVVIPFERSRFLLEELLEEQGPQHFPHTTLELKQKHNLGSI